MENGATIPLEFASLIILYTHNKVSDTQQEELDRWVVASEENLLIFEELTDGLDDAIFTPSELITSTAELLDSWMIAGLIAREMEGIITTEEKASLTRWIETSEANQKIYQALSEKANLHKFFSWFKRSAHTENRSHLN